MKKISIFAFALVHCSCSRIDVKGNQVQILNRPAAVNPMNVSANTHATDFYGKAVRNGGKSENLPCTYIQAFVE